jgi:anti-sigma B factor antagonist
MLPQHGTLAPMSLEISLRYVDAKTVVVTLVGALTLGTGLKTADQQIQTAIEQGASRMAIDMSGVPYSDSAGLGVLIHTFGLTRKNQGALRLAAASERMVSMLTLTRMDTLLPLDPTVEASLAALG